MAPLAGDRAMTNDEDFCERDLDAPPQISPVSLEQARSPHTMGWWIAAGVAVAALIWAVVLLRTARPSPDTLQAAHDQSVAEAQIDTSSYGRALTAAQNAQATAARAAQVTDAAARTAANSADTAAQNATASAPVPAE
jgi:hypothetical protein